MGGGAVMLWNAKHYKGHSDLPPPTNVSMVGVGDIGLDRTRKALPDPPQKVEAKKQEPPKPPAPRGHKVLYSDANGFPDPSRKAAERQVAEWIGDDQQPVADPGDAANRAMPGVAAPGQAMAAPAGYGGGRMMEPGEATQQSRMSFYRGGGGRQDGLYAPDQRTHPELSGCV